VDCDHDAGLISADGIDPGSAQRDLSLQARVYVRNKSTSIVAPQAVNRRHERIRVGFAETTALNP
jgi:hypothetical protein